MFEIDLRTYDYPLGYVEIKDMLMSKDHTCLIAADEQHQVVGFAVLKSDRPKGVMEVVRLAVHPKHRGLGAAKLLLEKAEEFCVTCKLHEMFINVPETKCIPRDPDDVSRWLKFQGFKAVTPLLKDAFEMYGGKVDGIKFVRPVDVT
jgi:N-acetylglutamate synthase-like GNAT family acetyltransferase